MGTKPMSVKLEAEEREAQRQSFIAEAEASWIDYQETGLHITLEEFSSWVEKYQDNPEAPVPECHT